MHCSQLSEMCLYGSRTPKLVVAGSSPTTGSSIRASKSCFAVRELFDW
jgi:hypothetical protein